MRRMSRLWLLLPMIGIVMFLLYPAPAASGAGSGLHLAAEVLIPSLFPVGVLSGCLVRMGPEPVAERLAGPVVRSLFGLPGAAAVPLILGLLGGFPLGSQLVCTMYREGKLTRSDAERLSVLCNNAGPGFLIGVAGSVLGDVRLGIALLVVQVLSVLLVGFLLRKPIVTRYSAFSRQNEPTSFADALLKSIKDTSGSMLTLTGTLCFFHAALACLTAVLPFDRLPSLLQTTVTGVLELSGGIAGLRGTDAEQAFPIAALLIGWGGVCVYLQAASAFCGVGLSIRNYLFGKLIQSLICFLLAILFSSAFHACFSIPAILSAILLLTLTFFSFFKKRHWKTSSSVI